MEFWDCETFGHIPASPLVQQSNHRRIMEREAKRNAKRNAKRDAERDRLLQQAFTAEDPAPLLLDILKKDPAYPALSCRLLFRRSPKRSLSCTKSRIRPCQARQFHRCTFLRRKHTQRTSLFRVGGITLQVVRCEEEIRCRVRTQQHTPHRLAFIGLFV